MTDAMWDSLSSQAITMAGLVYFGALICHLLEWAWLRQVSVEPAAVSSSVAARTADRSGGVAVATGGSSSTTDADDTAARTAGESTDDTADPDDGSSHRVAFVGRLGVLLTVLACGVHLVGLVSRGMAADPNRVPWGNMYEFTITGSFIVAAMYLALFRRFRLQWLAPLVVGFVLATLMVAMIWLHEQVAPLNEALNSYWLVIHVVSAAIATGAFTLGGLASAVYLVKARRERKSPITRGWLARVPSLQNLDRFAYRVHAFAFPVWTFAVLITGPIWAHEAWSRYWNWDPKEVWAFITWVVYAGYLHARATAGWRGRNAALLALVGVATLWFNFIGINYFSTTSQHSYASHAPIEPGRDVDHHASPLRK